MTADEDVIALLPCPFCGSPAELVDEATFGFWANCTSSGDCYGKRETFDNCYHYKADAINDWNRRESLSRVGGREAER